LTAENSPTTLDLSPLTFVELDYLTPEIVGYRTNIYDELRNYLAGRSTFLPMGSLLEIKPIIDDCELELCEWSTVVKRAQVITHAANELKTEGLS
jgi:hypothetical protein